MGRKNRIPIQFGFSLDLGLIHQPCFMDEGVDGAWYYAVLPPIGQIWGTRQEVKAGNHGYPEKGGKIFYQRLS